jgi:hypothetical protein
MPKLDPKGEVQNPIKAKLAHDIAKPLAPPVQKSEVNAEEQPTQVIKRLSQNQRGSSKFRKAKKVLFTAEEQKGNDDVVSKLAKATGADTLVLSHVDRALWSLLRRAEDRIERNAAYAPQLVRPSNGNPFELADFEESLAVFLHHLLKDMPRLQR